MDPLFVIATICSLIAGIILYLQNHYSFWSKRNIPGPKPNLLIGNYNEINKESHLTLHEKWIKKFGKVFGIFEMSRPKLMVADADLIKTMLVRDFASLTDRRTDGFDHPLETKFSFVLEGNEWKRTRGALTPAFTSAKFKNNYEQFEICADKLVEHFNQLISSGKANDIDAMELFQNYFGDTLSRSIFNASFVDSYSEQDKITDSVVKYFEQSKMKLFLSNLLPRWFKTMIKFSSFRMNMLQSTISLFEAIIGQRKKSADNNNQAKFDILKMLMDSATKLNWQDDDILANLILLYAGGFVSTSLVAASLAYVLAKYPHIRENILAEINEIESIGEKITLETVTNKFKYLEAVINETQRLYPSSTYTERKVSAEEYTFEYNGKQHTIPKNTHIYFPIFLIHRDPDYFENPEQFDETRFLPENIGTIHPYAYLPFGHGPRNCIGRRFALINMKVAFINVVKHFKFSLVDEKYDPMDFSDTLDEILFTKPIRVRVEKCN